MQNANDINDMLDHPVGQLRKSSKFWGEHPSSESPWPPKSARRLDFDKAFAEDSAKQVPLLEKPTPAVWPKDKQFPSVPTGMTLPPVGGWAAMFQAEIDGKIDNSVSPTGVISYDKS